MDGGFLLNNLPLLSGSSWFGVPFYHIDTLNQGLIRLIINPQDLADPSFILVGNYFNLVIDLLKILSLLHIICLPPFTAGHLFIQSIIILQGPGRLSS